MARPLRIDVEGGYYHVSSRGIERRRIFLGKSYYVHFLGLLEQMSERYGAEVHAYCLMGNHYHLIIRTPCANASKAIQWLNVSYAAWFNAKQQRVGHVFQGRFKSVLIDNDGSWLLIASDYLHLNPVRTSSQGLDKRSNKAEKIGIREPGAEQIKQRLEKLRLFQWSSYCAYAGYAGSPKWLHTEVILGRSGGKEKFRKGVQTYVARAAPEAFECLQGRVAIGATEFVERARQLVGKVSKEQPDRSFVRKLIPFEVILKVVESKTGRKWEEFGKARGDAARNLVFYLARKRSGLTLREIGGYAGGVEYKMVGKAIKRCETMIESDRSFRMLAKVCRDQLATFET